MHQRHIQVSHSSKPNFFIKGKSISPALFLLSKKVYPRGLTFQLFISHNLLFRSIKGNVFHYSAVISDCVRVAQWKLALHVFGDMDTKSITKNTVTYNSTMTACEHGGQWKLTLSLWDEMTKLKIPKVPVNSFPKLLWLNTQLLIRTTNNTVCCLNLNIRERTPSPTVLWCVPATRSNAKLMQYMNIHGCGFWLMLINWPWQPGQSSNLKTLSK